MRMSLGQKLVGLGAWFFLMVLSLFVFGLLLTGLLFLVSVPIAIRIAVA
jgi:hypothetical protein